MQPRTPSNPRGIDVSHHQGSIDWPKVAASGITFAIIKATEGKTHIDHMLEANVKGALAAGLKISAYHFCRAHNPTDAVKEAQHFIDTVKTIGGFGKFAYPPVLDIETTEGKSKENITTICQTWLRQVQEACGDKPIIYTYLDFARNYLDKSLAIYPLWFARYDKNRPENVAGWTKWMFLQHTNQGKVPGISGNVDLNEYDPSVLLDRLAEDVGVLVRAGIINTPEMWAANAVPGKKIKGEYAAELIKKYVASIDPDFILAAAVGILAGMGFTVSPNYWLDNAKAGKTVDGEFARQLIEKMARGQGRRD